MPPSASLCLPSDTLPCVHPLAVGGAFGSRSSFGGSWDLRASNFRSPASLMRIRSQAEKVFNDSMSSSLFTSPSMQHFKAQTDSIYADVTSTMTKLGVFSAVDSVRSTIFSWFG